jgi:hypothetical protein
MFSGRDETGCHPISGQVGTGGAEREENGLPGEEMFVL